MSPTSKVLFRISGATVVLAAMTALLVMTGCTSLTEEQITEKRMALRAYAVAQIDAWNAAGVDPLQVDEERVARFSLACATVAGASVLIPAPYGDVPEEELTDKQRAQLAALTQAPAVVADFCAVVAKALAPAPVASPEPAPKPAA